MRLAFDPALPQAWRTAFRSAAAEWSRLSGIDIRENNSGLTFLEIHYYRFNFLFPDTDSFAKGWLPPWEADGIGTVKVGKIAVNAGYVGSCFTGTDAAAQRLKTAMHEIGHTLGLKHPTEGFHIQGTASGTGYSTVMTQGCIAMTALQSDDIASADRLY